MQDIAPPGPTVPARPDGPGRAGHPTIVLYQPDIAGNTGTLLRLGACLALDVELVEPAGFDVSDRALRRAGMDYLEMARLVRHVDFEAFDRARKADGRRLVLLTTKACEDYRDFAFRAGDCLLFGRESAGVPDHVHARADHRLAIPMAPGARSLNLALSAAIVAAEALRQLRPAPHDTGKDHERERPGRADGDGKRFK